MLDSLDTVPAVRHTANAHRPLRIAGYHPQYAQETIALAKRMHADSTYAHVPFDETAVEQFLSYIDQWRTAGFLALHNTHGVVGFIAVQLSPLIFAQGYVANELVLYVTPEMRHTKAFAGLVVKAERWAEARGARGIISGASGAADPDKAVRAYAKLGYSRTGILLSKEFS
jgi:GNAT superfamily N-acetyltransferase